MDAKEKKDRADQTARRVYDILKNHDQEMSTIEAQIDAERAALEEDLEAIRARAYCNYGKGKFGEEITVIKPCFWDENTLGEKVKMDCWRIAMRDAEDAYFALLDEGCSPQEARSVLPNSLKTEVVMTANIREWRHFLKLRCSPAAHPQMREVALILLDKVHWLIPVCFDDIWSEYHADV